jgi:hypothetical protein
MSISLSADKHSVTFYEIKDNREGDTVKIAGIKYLQANLYGYQQFLVLKS